ncbi:hypothetical protein GGR54DRAFT_430692 [Hypoxylon sp. NC1633]|nr:hypothetical protein GGR54DRAFT_430692 [Hypoxylon sp. NC1633]
MDGRSYVIRQPTLDSEDDSDDVFEDAQEGWGTQPGPALTTSDEVSNSPVRSEESPQRGADGGIQLPPISEDNYSRVQGAEQAKFRFTSTRIPIPPDTAASQPLRSLDGVSSIDEVISRQAATPDGWPVPVVEAKPPPLCEVCERRKDDVWFCNVCALVFCGQCWDAQIIHRISREGIPHEKTDPDIAAKVRNVLSPPIDDQVRERLYDADAPTAWFGVDRPDDLSPPMFQDYGRFTELMIATDPIRRNPSFLEKWGEIGRDKRTPSLVSFVGQTGAGKSTLVKLLIDFATNSRDQFSTPVIGPRGAHLPTSEDVHLYLDPRTSDSAGPLLYADCEGLEGGEREPLGAKFKRRRRQENTEASRVKAKIISERELQWANEPRARSREFAVTNLYPRLLYTFSDVIVFVLRNPRVIEHVFERLVKWAAAAIETSSNQPVLPHAIIALNASEHGLGGSPWDVRHNTETILDDLANTINRNVTFKKWAQFWRERGKPVNTLVDLILCYYSSIQIIRLPAEGRPNLMEEQIRKLYDGTLTACIAARCVRYQARMLLDVEDLHDYLQEAFSHYSTTLESPFDFVQASSRNSPIPQDFGGNILKLALNIMNVFNPQQHIDARRIFSELSYMVASCIMLDSARHNNKGSASQIFPKYIKHLDDALENFCNQHWPCEFVNPKTGVRCVNVKSGHKSKGHQTADGKVFAFGDWVSRFSFEDYRTVFSDWVYWCLAELLKELTTRVQDDGEAEERVAAHIHKTMVLTNLFSHLKHSDAESKADNYLVSHTACFCCLFGRAEHFLPCGHVLCSACVSTYGTPRKNTGFEIMQCPIEGATDRIYSPWTIQLKPKSAGTRIMTLDGGGIRGIVELEVLRQIEIALGGVAIQYFVDLIVGTSTGGLVALGLASMNWTVEECIGHFEALCHEAFTRRTGGTLPIIGSFIDNYHHSKYQTSTLENAFQSAFTDDIYLFGGRRPAGLNGPTVKVAVTATSLGGNKTYVLSNYNGSREGHVPNHYHFQRPELLSTELKVWEAARATAAAPTYFKSFHHEPSQKTYIDGAVLHNNPVRIADSERKILWPDDHVPDLFLSIGTGSSPALSRAESEHMSAARKGIFSHGRHLYGILRSNLEQTLDCERAWDDYFSSVTSALTKQFSTSRFLRINPNVGKIPALDEKDKMGGLRQQVQRTLRYDPRVKDVARQLLASTFYFELISASDPEPDGTTEIQGKIQCRLLQPSPEIHALGKHLKERAMASESLRFVIFEDGDVSPLMTVRLDEKITDAMIRDQVFNLGWLRFSIKNRLMPTQCQLYFGERTMHPISGFPRLIIQNSETLSPGLPIPDSLSGSPSFRYSHGSRRLKADSNWKPPDLRGATSFSNLRDYASHPHRMLGHDVVESGETQPTADPVPQTKSPTRERSRPSMELRRSTDSRIVRRRDAIREAFMALLWPLWPQRVDAESAEGTGSTSPTDPAPLPPDLEVWLNEYRRVQNETSDPTRELPESLITSLQHYNVRPEEYAVYQQWIGLLQPSTGAGGNYWYPPTNSSPGDFATSAPSGTYYELHDTAPIAELMGSLPPDSDNRIE